jgi:GNAT acetyltransferase-like protein
MSYGIHEIRLEDALRLCVKEWKECNARFPDHSLHNDPEWIAEHFKHSGSTISDLDQLDFAEPWAHPKTRNKENVRIYLLAKDDEIVGVVPFALDKQQLACGLGQFQVAKFPMRILCLQSTHNMPAEASAYDALFRQVLSSNPDAIYVNNVNTNAFFWNYLQNSTLIRRSFQFYQRNGSVPHQLIRLNGTFENYMGKFTAKTRKNRLRELRLLRERGNVQLMRVTKASEIDAFLEATCEVSKRTWQFDRGWGLRDPDVVRSKLQFLAQRGCLRSYLLKCGDVPCSFILGQQYGSRFYTEFAGADYRWRSYSVGSVLLLLVLEDLFKENSPQFYDFGNYVKWQDYFATESYMEASAWLFSRRAYPQLASSIYHACNAMSIKTGAVLDRFQMKSRVRQLLWRKVLPA